MTVISANKINKSYGIDQILTDVSFHINEGDRIGIVGANGAGKSTLIKIITGEYDYDSGELYKDKSKHLGYLQQREHFKGGGTVLDEMKNALSDEEKKRFVYENGYEYEKGIKGMLAAMAFGEEYYDQPVDLLSGGERTRLALAAVLLRHPDILLLDEPTNHLDIGTLKWLEDYLKSFKGTLIVISHDRFFLDKSVSRIFEIENTYLTSYEGNYSQYKAKKQLRYEEDMRHYEQLCGEIKRQEELIARWHGRGTEKLIKRAQSREKRLAHIQRPVKPTMLRESLRINFKEKLQSGNDVLFAEGLSKSFDRKLFENVDLDIKRGDRICLVGPNGIGKTTLLRILLGQINADDGYMRLGQNVVMGYYDQEQRSLNPENTVLEELHSMYYKQDIQEMRNILGSFLFHGDDIFLKVKDLAGGEKARLALLKLMMSGANFLIFDEPTNHLDISAKEVFEEALLSFPGTMLIVSHDRYLLQKIPTAIYELSPNGITVFLGGYDYYSEKKDSLASGKAYLREMGASRNEITKQDNEQLRRAGKKAAADAKRLQRLLDEAEASVSASEKEVRELETMLCDPDVFSDPQKAREAADALAAAKQRLENEYEKWLALQGE